MMSSQAGSSRSQPLNSGFSVLKHWNSRFKNKNLWKKPTVLGQTPSQEFYSTSGPPPPGPALAHGGAHPQALMDLPSIIPDPLWADYVHENRLVHEDALTQPMIPVPDEFVQHMIWDAHPPLATTSHHGWRPALSLIYDDRGNLMASPAAPTFPLQDYQDYHSTPSLRLPAIREEVPPPMTSVLPEQAFDALPMGGELYGTPNRFPLTANPADIFNSGTDMSYLTPTFQQLDVNDGHHELDQSHPPWSWPPSSPYPSFGSSRLSFDNPISLHPSDISLFSSHPPSISESTRSVSERVSIKEFVRRGFRYQLFLRQLVLGSPNIIAVGELLSQEWAKGLAVYKMPPSPLPWVGNALSSMIYNCIKVIRRDLLSLVEPVVIFQLGKAPEGVAIGTPEHHAWFLQRVRDLKTDCAFADPYGSPPFSNEALWGVIRTYLWAGVNKFAVAYPDDFKEGVPESVLSSFLTVFYMVYLRHEKEALNEKHEELSSLTATRMVQASLATITNALEDSETAGPLQDLLADQSKLGRAEWAVHPAKKRHDEGKGQPGRPVGSRNVAPSRASGRIKKRRSLARS